MEKLYCLLAFIFTGAGGFSYIVFGSTGKSDLFPNWFTQGPGIVSAKYPTPFSPVPAVAAIAWVFTFLTNMVAQMYLFVTLPKKRMFPGVFHFSWIFGAILTSTWAYSYSSELLVFVFVVFAIKLILLIIQVIVGMKVYYENSHQFSSNFRWAFQYIVLDSIALLTTYIAMMVPAMAIQAVGYKYSAHLDVSQHREWISFHTSEVMGAIGIVTTFLAWLVIDFVLYPKKSAILRSVYPTFTYVLFGFFISNYSSVEGLNRYNILCLVLFFISLVAFIFRYKIKGEFLNEKKNT